MKTEMGAGIYDSPDYHALIRGIRQIDRAGGDSSLARLVTADFLEENGEEERAACVRATTEDRRWYYDGSLGRLREFGILKCLPDSVADYEQTGGVAAGFLSLVRCPLAWWMAHGPDICRRHPVEKIKITDRVVWRSGNVVGQRLSPPATATFSSIPPDVFDRFAGGQSHAFGSRLYATDEESIADLNEAALRWAEAVADGETE